MKTRKMYASPGWGDAVTTGFGVRSTPNAFQVVPVLVTDATDMPDFEPGDRVRQTTPSTDVFGLPVAWHEYEIAHIYFDGERWCFYSTDRTRHPLAKYTKLPREKTETYRITRTDDQVVDVRTWLRCAPNGVRVERVEDDDA